MLGRRFTRNIKPYFHQKIKVEKAKMSSAAILLDSLRGNSALQRIPIAFKNRKDSVQCDAVLQKSCVDMNHLWSMGNEYRKNSDGKQLNQPVEALTDQRLFF